MYDGKVFHKLHVQAFTRWSAQNTSHYVYHIAFMFRWLCLHRFEERYLWRDLSVIQFSSFPRMHVARMACLFVLWWHGGDTLCILLWRCV